MLNGRRLRLIPDISNTRTIPECVECIADVAPLFAQNR